MDLREQAAQRALDWILAGPSLPAGAGLALGLGTGATATCFVDLLGQQLRRGALAGLVAVPTSEGTAQRARAWGIPLTTLDECGRLDLVVDGADEVDPQLDLVKGLGRALLREKIVAVHSARMLIVVDESKLVPRLGTRGPLPAEVVPFAAEATLRWLNTLGCWAEFRLEEDGGRAVTDNGNYLVHCHFSDGIADPHALARALAERPGVVEHGLFLGMATAVIVAGAGGVRVLERSL